MAGKSRPQDKRMTEPACALSSRHEESRAAAKGGGRVDGFWLGGAGTAGGPGWGELGWGERPGELTMIVKLPISAGMVRDIYFARESGGGFKQHNRVIAHIDAEDDILAELPTL